MPNTSQPDLFEEGKETLIQPDHHHHRDLEGSGDDFDQERTERLGQTSERSEANAREKLSLKSSLSRRARAMPGEKSNSHWPNKVEMQ